MRLSTWPTGSRCCATDVWPPSARRAPSSWAYYGGILVTGLLVTLITSTVLALVAAFGFGVGIEPAMIPRTAVVVVLAGVCFAVLGALVVAFVTGRQAARVVALGTFLPLAFVSGVFVVGGELPAPLRAVGDVLLLNHVSHALLAVFDPASRPRLSMSMTYSNACR